MFIGAVYNTLACQYKDPGIIPRPADFVEKKAKWEMEEKARREEEEKKKLEEAKGKFDSDKMRRVDYDDTPIQMNETVNSDKDTAVEQSQNGETKNENTNGETKQAPKKAKKGKKGKKQKSVKKDEKTENQLHIHSYRFCNTCQIERPPLASHCGMCGHCVRGFDHHCTVTNCCIAERNLRNFALLQFLMGCCAIAALYILPAYYYEIAESLDEDKFNYFKKYWVKIILWLSLGYFCMGLATLGAMPCMLPGTVGYVMSSWIMIEGLWADDKWALYPFFCSFALPMFFGLFFMGAYYFYMIANGQNKKILAAIQKYQQEKRVKYEAQQESCLTKTMRLLKYLF